MAEALSTHQGKHTNGVSTILGSPSVEEARPSGMVWPKLATVPSVT